MSMLLLLDPCPLFHTRPIEWRHSRTGPDPALRRTWRPNFTHEGAVTPGALAPVRCPGRKVRGRGRTEWPFGGPIGTVHTRKYVTLLAFDVIFQKLGGQIRVYSSPKCHYWLI